MVLPIRNELLAKLLLAIEDALVNTVPVSSGNVIVLSAVGSVTAKVVSKSLAVAPSNIICPEPIVMLFVCPVVNAVSVLDVREVSPLIVVAVPPSAIAVPPIVTSLFAN